MPISKSHLKKNQRTLDVEYFGDIVRVVYKPSEITPTTIAEISDATEEGDQYATPRILARALIQWDLAETEDDPTVLTPITFDELKHLDSGFLGAIINQVTADMFPKSKNGRR